MNLDQNICGRTLLARAHRWAVNMGIAAALAAFSAGGAMAASYDGAMGRTSYVAMTGDYNGDGQNDVLMKAVPKVVMIPLDDDLVVPISIAPPSPTFALISTAYGNYTLVVSPAADLIGSPSWKPATQQLVYAGANGAIAGAVTITASNGEQASFTVSMAANGQLQLTSTTPPLVDTTKPHLSADPLAVDVAVPHMGNPDAGTLQGVLSVGQTGAATYVIDLVVPPGTAGMQPALSLQYDSLGANGIAGLGWLLNGGASIQRCSKTIAQDGNFDRITLTNSDRLCLNGGRMLQVDGANPGTDTNARDSAYWAAGAVYRTEFETFSRITRLPGGGFKVEAKDNSIQYFGTDPGSASQAQGRADGKPMQWLLARSEDRNGNYLTWEYNASTASGEVTPKQIRYGSNTLANQIADLAVRFAYEARPDPFNAYMGGSRQDTTTRLVSIKTYIGTDTLGNGGTQARGYELHYKQSTSSGRSLVDWIQASAINPNTNVLESLPKTSFDWTDTPAVPAPVTDAPLTWPYFDVAPSGFREVREPMQVLARLDGSGRTSMVSVHMTACGLYNEPNCFDPDFGILHATGRLGIRSPEGVVSEITVDFAPLHNTALGPLQMGLVRKTPSYLQFGDVNGDGRDDILAVDNSGSDWYVDRFVWGVCLNDGVNAIHFTCIPGATTDPIMAELRSDKKTHMISFDGLGNPGTDCFYNNASARIECKTMAVSMETPLPADLKKLNRQNFFKPRGANFGRSMTDFYALWQADVPAADPNNYYRNMWYYDMSRGTGVWQPIDVIHGVTTCFYSDKGLACKTIEQIRSVGKLMRDISAPQSVGDLNGDGLTDFMYVVRAAKPTPDFSSSYSDEYVSGIQQPSTLRVCLSKETAMECTSAAKTFAPNADYTDPAITAQIDDFTGDGITRVMFDVRPNSPSLAGAKSELCRWTPNGFVCQDTAHLVVGTRLGTTQTITFGTERFEGGAAILTDAAMPTFFVKSQAKINGAQAWTPWRMESPPGQDKLARVTDGIGSTAELSYARGDDAAVYARLATIDNVLQRPLYPQFMVPPGVMVKQARRSNGKGGMRNTDYYYEGRTADAEGRSAPGFGRMRETELQTQLSSMSVFRRDYPFSGELVRKTITARNGGVVNDLTIQHNKQDVVFANGARTVLPFIETASRTKTDLDGSALNTVTTSNQFGDSWGNLTRQTETTSGAGKVFTKVQAKTFKNVEASWLLGLPELVTVTRTDPDAGALTRTMNYEYDAQGVISREYVEKGTPLQQLVTHERTLNPFGLLDKSVQQWVDPYSGSTMSRKVKDQSYDPKGRFIVVARDATGLAETHDYYPSTGVRRSLRSANQLTTSWVADGFGRIQIERRPDGNETRSYMKLCSGTCPLGATVAAIGEHFNAGKRTVTPSVAYTDVLGNKVRALEWSFNGKEIVTDARFDEQGRLDEVDHPRFSDAASVWKSKILYDDFGRATEVQSRDTGGGTIKARTLYNGALVTHIDQLQKSTVDTRDALGRMVKVRDTMGGETSTAYDGFGNALSIRNPNGNVISLAYDRLGRKTDMNDPDLGLVHYDIDPLGRTWRQSTARQRAANQSTRFEHDAVNRVTGRYEPDLESHWVFDSAANGVGQLAEAYTKTGALKDYQRLYTYDSLGRVTTTSQTVGGAVFKHTLEYDAFGRVIRQKHQRGLGAVKMFDMRYNDKGYLALVERGTTTLWRVVAQDAEHRPTEVALGNGLVQKSVFEPFTSRLDNNDLRLAGALRLMDSYKYDKLANISQRDQLWDVGNFSESFGYDDLSRLTSSTVSGQGGKLFTYDAAGNMKSKTGTGTGEYVYPAQGSGAARPHSVQSIPGIGSFIYDSNGNMQSGAGRSISWNSFNMPIRIERAPAWSSFVYGPEHQRTVQQRSDGTVISYAGSMEAVQNGAALTLKTYWPNGLGVEVEKPDGSVDLNWIHKDRLGSPVAISSSAGALRERLAFDAWGKRRTPDGSATPDALDGVVDNKGYTGHEMLDQLDLVHMNGRIYDPLVARFMSGDPHVTDPSDGQNYNRYSYVLNNPMGSNDPTGLDGCFGATTICGARDPWHGSNTYSGFDMGGYGMQVARENSPTIGRGNAIGYNNKSKGGTMTAAELAKWLLSQGVTEAKSGDLAAQLGASGLATGPLAKSDMVFDYEGKTIRIIGGTLAQQELAKKNFELIFKTPHGKEMLDILKQRDQSGWFGGGKRDFVLDFVRGKNRSDAPYGKDVLFIDPNFRELETIDGSRALVQPSLLRLMAHEMGHAVYGTHDWGTTDMYGRPDMKNVTNHETPIMRALGMPARIKYP